MTSRRAAQRVIGVTDSVTVDALVSSFSPTTRLISLHFFRGGLLHIDLPIERGHADSEHLRRLLARATVELDRLVNVAAFLFANVFIERLANRQRTRVFGRRRAGVANDLRGKIADADEAVVAQRAGAFD